MGTGFIYIEERQGGILSLLLLVLIMVSCKPIEPEGFLIAETLPVLGVTGYSAFAGGMVTHTMDGGPDVAGFCWNSNGNPTLEDDTVHCTDHTGEYYSEIINLLPGRSYYLRAFAIDEIAATYGEQVEIATLDISDVSIIDIDNNTYPTVKIGEQVWMQENLKTTRFPDGSLIPYVEENAQWVQLGEEDMAYCWYTNDTQNKETYGGLYSWQAAMYGAANSELNSGAIQGVCPDGWHLPSHVDWVKLTVFLGLDEQDAIKQGSSGTDEGSKMKESGTMHWNYPNQGGNNGSGFSALPGGRRDVNGFLNLGKEAFFWTSTSFPGGHAWYYSLSNEDAVVSRNQQLIQNGYSVRCIKGEASK